MSRNVTLKQLRDRLDQTTNNERNKHLTEPEKNAILASAACETWDKIIATGSQNIHTKPVTFNTVAQVREYSMDDASIVPDKDFYKVHQIYIDESNGQFRPLPKLNPAEIQAFRAPQSIVAVKLYYIPQCPTFKNADGSWNDAATFDGINGWEEHTLMTAAMSVKFKKQDDYSMFARRKSELEERIAQMAEIDYSEAPRVTRRRRRAQDPFMLFRNNVNAWLIRNNTLELMYHYGYVP